MSAAVCLVPSGSRRLRYGCARIGVTGRYGHANGEGVALEMGSFIPVTSVQTF